MFSSQLKTEWEVIDGGPDTAANKSIAVADFPEDVDEEADGVVRCVFREHIGSVADGNSAAAALGEVDVVDAGAAGDDEAQGGEETENGLCDRAFSVADHGLSGLSFRLQEDVDRKR